MSSYHISPIKLKRKLKAVVIAFLLALSLPLYCLFYLTLANLKSEAFHQQRLSAELLTQAMDARIIDLLSIEEKRTAQSYLSRNLLDSNSLPGLLAYFAISETSKITAFANSGQPGSKWTSLSEGEIEALLRDVGLPRKTKVAIPAEQIKQLNRAALEQKEGELDYDKGAPPSNAGIAPRQLMELNIAPEPPGIAVKDSDYRNKYYARKKEAFESARSMKSQQSQVGIDAETTESNEIASKLSSESSKPTISPFYVIVDKGYNIIFWREVWSQSGIGIQGFICNLAQFLEATIGSSFSSSELAGGTSMLVAFNGLVVKRYEPIAELGRTLKLSRSIYSPRPEQKQILLYKNFLTTPMESFEIVYSTTELPMFGLYMLGGLGLAIVGVIIIGSWALYSLASRQIELASERSNFVSAISHELRTPLTSIRMYAEMLKGDLVVDENKRQTYYDYIFSESERLSRLIENVLYFSRLSSAKSSIKIQALSAQDILSTIESKVSGQVSSTGFELVAKSQCPHELMVQADEDSLCQIVINLVDNALKFSKGCEMQTIEIGLRPRSQDDKVELYVRDYGPGIEDSQIKKIFRLFYRGENELTRSTSGTGIGLAIVEELARNMGVRLDVAPKSPGVEFKIILAKAQS
jgi:signal transduction histidine kinase